MENRPILRALVNELDLSTSVVSVFKPIIEPKSAPKIATTTARRPSAHILELNEAKDIEELNTSFHNITISPEKRNSPKIRQNPLVNLTNLTVTFSYEVIFHFFLTEILGGVDG